MFSSLTSISTYSYVVTTLKYNILPIRKNVLTLSKGPMVRKKQSREQYSFKQIFINITKVIQFENKKKRIADKRRVSKFFPQLASDKSYLRTGQIFNFSKIFENKLNTSLFYFMNFNVNYFRLWVSNIKMSNVFIETNLFFLKKLYLFVNFHDIIFFHIVLANC